MSKPHWTLNGVYLAPFKRLPEESISKLKRVGEFHGCEVFINADLPAGTLELWQDEKRIASITGIQP